MRPALLLIRLGIIVLALAAGGWYRDALAQDWRGPARIAGTVRDRRSGEPLSGVTIRASRSTAKDALAESTTDAKGSWAINGLAAGSWKIQFSKHGYASVTLTALVLELRPLPAFEVEMSPVQGRADGRRLAEDQLSWAAKMMDAGQFEAAREIYSRLAASNPGSAKLDLLIARTYAAEHDSSSALAHLHRAIQTAPTRPEPRLIAANILMDSNRLAEAKEMCAGIDEGTLDGRLLQEQYAALLVRLGEHARAIVYLDRIVHADPTKAQPYYYRGLANAGLHRQTEARRDLESFIHLASAGSPDLPKAKELLNSIRDDESSP